LFGRDFLEILENSASGYENIIGAADRPASRFPLRSRQMVHQECLVTSTTLNGLRLRLLRIARGDQTPLPGFEQDDYVKVSNASSRKFSDLLEEFKPAITRASSA